MTKVIRLAITILAPTGVPQKKDTEMPAKKQTAESMPDVMMTLRNVLHICIEVNAGKIIRLEISRVPIILIPRTTVSAVSTAMTTL